MRFFLDEGVPRSVGNVLEKAGHTVLYFHDNALAGSKDILVCAIAEKNDAVLVAIDGDMKQIARGHGVGSGRFKKLSLLKISCRETSAAKRVQEAMSLIEHEWALTEGGTSRRIFIEIHNKVIRTIR